MIPSSSLIPPRSVLSKQMRLYFLEGAKYGSRMTSRSAFKPRDTIRWGIIGCGDVTEVKSGPGFQKSTGSQLVAVMRRDAARAEDYARRHGVPKWYSDAAALINDPEVDAVYVATPPSTHCDFALKVCRSEERRVGKE